MPRIGGSGYEEVGSINLLEAHVQAFLTVTLIGEATSREVDVYSSDQTKCRDGNVLPEEVGSINPLEAHVEAFLSFTSMGTATRITSMGAATSREVDVYSSEVDVCSSEIEVHSSEVDVYVFSLMVLIYSSCY
ncbi:hypothetical protein J6590_024797 [Homalodisca vitripennis]|nr:hypothetical protein J6590_024797 [Homalodisca vitripennis]